MYRTDYPRPDFVREQWLCLNGRWDFEFDDDCRGFKEHWEAPGFRLGGKIEVPFAYQAPLSGIGRPERHDRVWYKRRFTVPENWAGREVLLHLGAVDYECAVFVNGFMAGRHEGGHVGFSFYIGNLLNENENELAVYVYDPLEEEQIPRGKQALSSKPHSIWYTQTTGIWQSVWLEPVGEESVEGVRITPDIDAGLADMEINLRGCLSRAVLEVCVSFQGETIILDRIAVNGNRVRRAFDIFQNKVFRSSFHGGGWCWTPENPNLFEVKLSLEVGGAVADQVTAYFGMRKISAENGMLYLNNKPYYMKLVLDQGYWPDGLMTAPDDADFIRDIETAKAMGFNGCRKHQKIEDPRFLYWADRLGFLVWGEMPACASFGQDAARRTMDEFAAQVLRDYNHPCIVAWVPINESWGVTAIDFDKRQQSLSLALYHTARCLDGSRPVISNDGWQMTASDICAVHSYRHGRREDTATYEQFRTGLADKEALLNGAPAGLRMYASGFAHQGEPFVLSEFGGIAFALSGEEGWGYTVAETEKEFLSEYARVLDAVLSSKALAGFCYTQLTDVEQEINGLLTYDRRPKADPAAIRRINEGRRR